MKLFSRTVQAWLSSMKKVENWKLNIGSNFSKVLFSLVAILCLTPLISPAVALVLGLLIALLVGHPYAHLNHQATQVLLKTSVVGLGFGMNIHTAVQAGQQGIVYTVVSILGTLIFGYLLGRWLRIDKRTSVLISSGTAICGGSAIAAISPVIGAEKEQISVALGCVFVLNSIALLAFPLVGHYLGLSQTQFGLWCAIAIHDTSSVVGAASKYGSHALEVATTVKLARALWIIPLAFLATFIFKSDSKKINIPYFIGWFVFAIVLNTYIPAFTLLGPYLVKMAKAGLTLTLFLIGAGLSGKVLASVGLKPFLQGILLWISISAVALYAVMHVH